MKLFEDCVNILIQTLTTHTIVFVGSVSIFVSRVVFKGGSQSRLPFVYRGLKINDQRLRGTLSRRHKCAKRGECGAPSATRRIPSYLASFHRVGKALTEQ